MVVLNNEPSLMEMVMDSSVSKEQHWQMTSAIGNFVLPIMSTLPNKLPNMLGAILCTADGFNICSIGLDELDVGKVASLSSSMFSIGGAVVSTLETSVESLSSKQKKEMLLTISSFQVAIVEVEHVKMDNLILLVAVDKTATGAVFMTIRKVVDILEKKLKHMSTST